MATDRKQSNLALCARECRETTAARAVTQPHVDALEGAPPRGADAAAAAAVHSGMRRRHAHLIVPPRYRGHTSLLHTGAPAPPQQRSPGANEPHRRVHPPIAVFTDLACRRAQELCTPGQRQDTRRDSSNSITTTTTCSRHYCPKTDATLSAEEVRLLPSGQSSLDQQLRA